MIKLKSEHITLTVSEVGAEIRKVLFNGKSVFWSGDPSVWDGISPLLFPMCGSLMDNKFTVNGKEYTSLPKHGYAKSKIFEIESANSDSVTLLHSSDSETKKMYPWDYELRVTYKLSESAITVEYDVLNTSEGTMYFSIGSHEAYSCPDGIENYDIIFEKNETLYTEIVNNSILTGKRKLIVKDSNVLPLSSKYFLNDALVFKGIQSRTLKLINRKNGSSVTVEFPNSRNILFWTKPHAPYICIEPWNGIPPTYSPDYNYAIDKKEGIEQIVSGASWHSSHTISFK